MQGEGFRLERLTFGRTPQLMLYAFAQCLQIMSFTQTGFCFKSADIDRIHSLVLTKTNTLRTSRPLDFFAKSFFLLANECPCFFFRIADHATSGLSPLSTTSSSHETWNQCRECGIFSTRLSETSLINDNLRASSER